MKQNDEILQAIKFLSDKGAFENAKTIMKDVSKTDEEKLLALFQLALEKASRI